VLLEIKIKVFPNYFTDSRLRKPDKSVGSCGWKRDISIGLATEGKVRENPTGRWQTESSIRGGDCGDYDYDDHYDMQHTGRLKQQPTNPGH